MMRVALPPSVVNSQISNPTRRLVDKMSYLPHRQLLCFALFLSTLSFQTDQAAFADEESVSLHQKIDSILNQTQTGSIAEPANDSIFLRRVYLDLIGRIPTINETRAFLYNEDPAKRVVLVDQLLASDEFNQHMAVVFDLMLMERRGGKHVKQDEFRQYLRKSFEENKSFLQLTKEILAADGTAEKNRPAAAFYLERDVAPDLLTREIGRVFFGVDLQCAQCHNHPNIDDYHQEDYYGLQAFIVRASLFQPDKKKPALISEKAEGEAAFNSVFTSRSSMTGPRILDGEELVEVSFKPGERYKVAPAKNVRSIPTESRLEKLATSTTSQPTNAFNRNIANRLWAHMLGRGLVHPVDLHHSANPPSHPALLELLSEDIAARNFDVKSFLREIALSEVYQRDSVMKLNVVDVAASQKQIEALKAQADQELEKSYQADEEVTAATEQLDAAFAELEPLNAEIEKANKVIAEALKQRDVAQAKVDKTTKSIADQEKNNQLVVKAYEQSKVASEALKEDKELASATAILLKKKDSLAAALAKLQETVKKEQADLAKKVESLKATYPAADAAIAKAKPFEEKVRKLRTEQIEKRKIAANYRNAASVATQKAESLQTLVDYSLLVARISELNGQIPQLQKQLDTARKQLPEMVKIVAEKSAAMNDAQQAMMKAEEQLKSATSQLTEEKATATLLAEALAKVNAVSERIEGDNPLKNSQTEISFSIEKLNAQLEQSQNELKKHQSIVETAKQNLLSAQAEVKSAKETHARQQKTISELDTELKKAKSELDQSKEKQSTIADEVLSQSADRLKMAEVVHLTPEQLGWSMLVATGQRDRQLAAEASKLNKEKPLSEEDLKDSAKVASREKEVEEATLKTLTNRVSTFLPLYGSGAGQPQHNFFATADQALFLSNGNELKSWLAPAAGNLTDRLNKISDSNELAVELYLSLFCRMPETEEIQLVESYLHKRSEDKSAAIQELAWSLLTSAEFRFQY